MRKSTWDIDHLYTNSLTLSGLSCRRRIRTAVLKDMGLVRFHFSILRYTWTFSIFVPAAHKPTVSYILDSILIFCLFYKIVGEDGVEPPELLSNRFTVCPATSTEYSPITRKPRVSNMFIVLCFPLGCFMPWQSHGVVSDLDINVFIDNDKTFYTSLENFLSSTCTYWRQFNSETVPNGEPSSSNGLRRYAPFVKIIHIHSFSSFFCP